jgi:hypothetical protein
MSYPNKLGNFKEGSNHRKQFSSCNFCIYIRLFLGLDADALETASAAGEITEVIHDGEDDKD